MNNRHIVYSILLVKNSPLLVGFECRICFGLFCNMILTDAWQPITSSFGSHSINREKFTPPSVTLTFVLASGKRMEGSFYLTNSSAWEHVSQWKLVLQLLEFHSCFPLSDYYFKISSTLQCTPSKESCLWENFPGSLLHSFKCRATLGTKLWAYTFLGLCAGCCLQLRGCRLVDEWTNSVLATWWMDQ